MTYHEKENPANLWQGHGATRNTKFGFENDSPNSFESKAENPQLALALAYATAGLPVFPCKESGEDRKAPYIAQGFKAASAEPRDVKEWWGRWPNALVGLPTGAPSELSVVDLDVDKETGETVGETEFSLSGVPEDGACSNPTASGGRHIYFRYSGKISDPLAKFGKKIDVRGDGGYVIAAGNPGYGRVEGLLERLHSLPEYPAAAIAKARAVYENGRLGAKSAAGGATVRVPAAFTTHKTVEEARELLSFIDPSCGREDWLEVLMALHDAGDHLLPLAVEWSAGSTEKYRAGEVENFWRGFTRGGGVSWATLPAKARQNGADLSAIHRKTSARETGAKLGQSVPAKVEYNFKGWEEIDFASIKPIRYIYGDRFAEGYLNVTVAAPKVGKSLLALAEAIDACTGRGFLTGERSKPIKVLYYNAEDDMNVMSGRVEAVLSLWGVSQAEIAGRLFVVSGINTDPPVVFVRGDKGELDEGAFAGMTEFIMREGIKLAIFDPLQDLSHSPETNEVFRALGGRVRLMAHKTKCAIGFIHHTRKPTVTTQVTIDDARGGSAIRGVARFNRLLLPMSEAEGAKAGVADHRRYFRIGEIESNLTPPTSEQNRWFEKVSIGLANGQSSGTVKPWKWPEAFIGVTNEHALRLQALIVAADRLPRANKQAAEWVGRMLATVLGWDIEWTPNQRGNDDRARIARLDSIITEWLKRGFLVKMEGKDEKRQKTDFINVGEVKPELTHSS